jgi:hypothetical protein
MRARGIADRLMASNPLSNTKIDWGSLFIVVHGGADRLVVVGWLVWLWAG